MKPEKLKITRHMERAGESGQTMAFVMLVLSFFLLGSAAFAVDLANIWFHRQMAQNAADAACTAGAMDLLEMAQGGAARGNFPVAPAPGGGFDCTASTPNTANTSPVPCWYASVNGYPSATNLSPGTSGPPTTDVKVSFPDPASIPGIAAPPASLYVGSAPFLQVNVIDRVQSFFIGLISGKKTMDVGALATCGMVASPSQVSILVLDPRNENAVDLGGSGQITIYGGGTRSVQVNASSTQAIQKGTIDLSQGGPNLNGGQLGVSGSTPLCCNFLPGAAFWDMATAQQPDPLALLVAPGLPGTTRAGPYATGVTINGCPAPAGCDEYAGGYYPTGIGITGTTVAIFDPGIYYMDGNLTAGPNSCLRPSTAPGDGTGGTMFYFNGSGAAASTVSVNSNSGSKCPANLPLANLKCAPASAVPANLPVGGLPGNVLVAPCTGPYGDQLGGAETGGPQRGILFFQNRSKTANPQWQGGGEFAFAGTMYFHQCVTGGGGDTGLNCSTTNAYNDQFSAGGNSCSSSYVIGSVIVDQIQDNGNACITMSLNPNPSNQILKVSLLR